MQVTDISILSDFKEFFKAYKIIADQYFTHEDLILMCKSFISNLLNLQLEVGLEPENQYYINAAKEHAKYSKSYTYFIKQSKHYKNEISELTAKIMNY